MLIYAVTLDDLIDLHNAIMIMCYTDTQSVFFVKGADVIELTARLFKNIT